MAAMVVAVARPGTRRGIRRNVDRPVPEELVQKLLAAAMQVSIARNQQPWQFIVIDDRVMPAEIAGWKNCRRDAREPWKSDTAIYVGCWHWAWPTRRWPNQTGPSSSGAGMLDSDSPGNPPWEDVKMLSRTSRRTAFRCFVLRDGNIGLRWRGGRPQRWMMGWVLEKERLSRLATAYPVPTASGLTSLRRKSRHPTSIAGWRRHIMHDA